MQRPVSSLAELQVHKSRNTNQDRSDGFQSSTGKCLTHCAGFQCQGEGRTVGSWQWNEMEGPRIVQSTAVQRCTGLCLLRVRFWVFLFFCAPWSLAKGMTGEPGGQQEGTFCCAWSDSEGADRSNESSESYRKTAARTSETQRSEAETGGGRKLAAQERGLARRGEQER